MKQNSNGRARTKRNKKEARGAFRGNERRSFVPRVLTLNTPTGQHVPIRMYIPFANNGVTNTVIETVTTNSLLSSGGSIFSTAVASFGRIYSKYRIERYRWKLTAVARSTTQDSEVSVYESASATAPFAVGSNLTATGAICDSRCKTKMLGASGNAPSIITLNGGMTVSELLANPENHQDDNYAGTITSAGVFTAPADTTLLYVGASPHGSGVWVISTSPHMLLEMELLAWFYEPRY